MKYAPGVTIDWWLQASELEREAIWQATLWLSDAEAEQMERARHGG